MKRLVLLFALLLVGCRPEMDFEQPVKILEAVHNRDGWNRYLVKGGEKSSYPSFYLYSRKHYRVGDSLALVEVKP